MIGKRIVTRFLTLGEFAALIDDLYEGTIDIEVCDYSLSISSNKPGQNPPVTSELYRKLAEALGVEEVTSIHIDDVEYFPIGVWIAVKESGAVINVRTSEDDKWFGDIGFKADESYRPNEVYQMLRKRYIKDDVLSLMEQYGGDWPVNENGDEMPDDEYYALADNVTESISLRYGDVDTIWEAYWDMIDQNLEATLKNMRRCIKCEKIARNIKGEWTCGHGGPCIYDMDDIFCEKKKGGK